MLNRLREPSPLLQPNGLPVQVSSRLEVVTDLTHIHDVELVARETEASMVALDRITHSREFQEVAMSRDHDRDFEVLIMLPGDPQYEILREAARCVEHAIFGPKDGESREDLDHHYGPYEAETAYVLAISRRGGYANPLGMMRLVHSGGNGMPSVDDMIGPPWFQDPVEMMAQTLITRPDIDNPDPTNPLHMMQMPDLRTYPGALDIVTAGTLPQYRRPASTGGVPIALAMYNATCRGVSLPAEIDLWATNLDAPAHRSIQISTGAPFSLYAQQGLLPEEERRLKQKPYYAVYDPVKKKYSNRTRSDYAAVPEWYAGLKSAKPDIYATVWGDALDGRVAFTTLGNMDAFKGDWESEKWARTRRALGETSLRLTVSHPLSRKKLYVPHPRSNNESQIERKSHFMSERECQEARRFLADRITRFLADPELTALYDFGEERYVCAQGLHRYKGNTFAVQVQRKQEIDDMGRESYLYSLNIISDGTFEGDGEPSIYMVDVAKLSDIPIVNIMDLITIIQHTDFRLEYAQNMAAIMQSGDPTSVNWFRITQDHVDRVSV